MTVRRRARCERGAVAVFAAVIVIMLISAGAIAVDLGNAMVRKRDVQSQADFAALAGASRLGEGNSKVETDPAVIAVAEWLTENQPQDDRTSTPAAIDPADLVDGDDTDGEVYFTGDEKMRVITPPAFVQFGLARVMGFNDLDVQADASVGIRSGGTTMPFYAVDGCDYGPQTITDPPPGPATPLNLYAPSDNGNANVNVLTPNQVDLNESPAPALVITGSTFTGGAADASMVGFFKDDGSSPETLPITPTSDTEISIAAVPTAVLSQEEIWYVRVYKNAKWSPVDEAKPFRVGSAVLECVGASNEGNFGSLLLPRNDSNNATSDGWLPINIAEGLQEPLDLDTHDAASSPSYTCVHGANGAITSDTSPPLLRPETNCVDTDTGLTDNAATAGFITGGSNGAKTFVGRLNKDTTPGCGSDSANRNARKTVPVTAPGPGHPQYAINDDLLTCFLSSGVSIQAISQETYAGPAVLDQRIFHSPRLFLQPVLGVDPTCGGCARYSIVDFRPGFITDQSVTAVGGDLTVGTDTQYNGLDFDGGQISRVKVVFFDMDALPSPPDDAPTISYIGAGPKLIRLLD